ncbi:MAG: DsbC family protein [Proteobacteria bacterium]|nr:DsbC family protein [Pseudomonadota bacterium]MBU1640549.1 DsbC family protein [Pseudomonadota bacterium]
MSPTRFIVVLLVVLMASPALAFQEGGCGAGDCRDCHALSREEAAILLKDRVNEVVGVRQSRVPGLWDIEALYQGRKVPLYLDFSKQYLITGNIIRLESGENLTRQSSIQMNRVDVSRIPLADAIIIGNPAAATKIIVFDDPECTYCRKLHPEMAEVVAHHEDIAFFIKMFPLAMHPKAYEKAKAIICAKSGQDSNAQALSLLCDSLAGKPLPASPPDCKNDQVDKNITLAHELAISSTPTLIMPDGRVLSGYKKADQILEAIKPKLP